MAGFLGEKKAVGRHQNSATDGTISGREVDPPCVVGTAGSASHPQIPAESIIILNYAPAHAASKHISYIIHKKKNGTAADRKWDDLEMLSYFSKIRFPDGFLFIGNVSNQTQTHFFFSVLASLPQR